RLHFTSERTMRTAQRLYEGVDLGSAGQGAPITYMRTDSTRVSNEALHAGRGDIPASYRAQDLPEKANTFQTRKSAGGAQAARRPRGAATPPRRVEQGGLGGDRLRLSRLTWQQFAAGQMPPAVIAVTDVEVTATPMEGSDRGVFKAKGEVLKFDGWRR